MRDSCKSNSHPADRDVLERIMVRPCSWGSPRGRDTEVP
jgi:hypothetical protein